MHGYASTGVHPPLANLLQKVMMSRNPGPAAGGRLSRVLCPARSRKRLGRTVRQCDGGVFYFILLIFAESAGRIMQGR